MAGPRTGHGCASTTVTRLWLMYLLFSAVLLLLMVGALVDIITRQDGQVKHLPKLVWVLLVVFLPVIGSLLWFGIGREYPAPADRPRFSRPSRRTVPSGWSTVAPVDRPAHRVQSTEDELAALEREIDFHAEQDRLRRLEAELQERRRPAADT